MMSLLAQAGATPLATPSVTWSLMWPLLLLSLGPILLLTVTSVVPSLQVRFPAVATVGIGVAAIVATIPIWDRVNNTEGPQSLVAGALEVDDFTVGVMGVIGLSVVLTALFLDDYLRSENLSGTEWYALLMLSAAGGIILAAASDLVVAFLGLEILSIAVYVLAALQLRRTSSQEAGFKYLILGALASALFLYGVAMVYGATGSTTLEGIASAGVNPAGLDPRADSSMILAGMALLFIGFAFKVSAVPFHVWTPDVYAGAPTPVVAYMATGVKVAAMAGFARVFIGAFGSYSDDWRPMVFALALLSMLVGSIAALAQTNVKRILAYSSVTHAGFMLAALFAAGAGLAGAQALMFYFVAYTLMAAGTFGILTGLSTPGDDANDLANYRGLARRQPLVSMLLAVLLFSQAGIPFTAGFVAKFRVILATVEVDGYLLAGLAMLSAVISAAAYLRIIGAVFLADDPTAVHGDDADAGDPTEGPEGTDGGDESPAGPLAGTEPVPPLVLGGAILAAVATVVFGVAPGLLESLVNGAGAALLVLTP